MTTRHANHEAVAALNAEFGRRWQVLWSTVQASSLQVPPDGRPRIPAIVETPPGDRRFAAQDWDELPYFALLKQSHLLAGEYALQLAALTPVPELEQRRLAS